MYKAIRTPQFRTTMSVTGPSMDSPNVDCSAGCGATAAYSMVQVSPPDTGMIHFMLVTIQFMTDVAYFKSL